MLTMGIEVEVKTLDGEERQGTIADVEGDDFIVILFSDEDTDDAVGYSQGTDGAWYDADSTDARPASIRFIGRGVN